MSDVPLRAAVFAALAEIPARVLAVMGEQLGLTPDEVQVAWRMIEGAIKDGSESVEFDRLTRDIGDG